VDCGSGHSEAGAQVSLSDIASYLHTVVGVAPVKVIISHPHFDHYRYVPELVPPTQVHSLWLGGLFAKYPKPVIDWADAVRDFGDVEMPRVAEQFEPDWHNYGYAVEDLACGDAASFVLTVNSGRNENANSLMLSIDHGDFRAIFTGDAEGATEAAAMANFPDAGVLVSTVVVSSHHGAKTHGSNGEAWIAATQPLIVLHSVGTQYGHPKCDVTERFQSVGSLLPAKPHMMSCDGQAAHVTSLAEYSTHESGAVVITSDASLERLRVECHPNEC
jgi:beta-lactamase superfamily II metal-dependent hydrolase